MKRELRPVADPLLDTACIGRGLQRCRALCSTTIQRPLFQFSEWLPCNCLKPSICSPTDMQRYDPGPALSFRTRLLSQLCMQLLRLSVRQLHFASWSRCPSVRKHIWRLSCPRELPCSKSCDLRRVLPYCSIS